jgi:hypothetical protein
MPKDFGMRRGIVVSNSDPKGIGRVKVFVPGVYPDEYQKSFDKLPWAEPAMGIFGGSWTSNGGSNKETGICSIPHAGTNGDGAQVWVFFEANDIRFPVYFAVAQSGAGWTSNHSNQHVIKSDNVSVVVDEYDDFFKIKEKTDIPPEIANENYNGTPEELNEAIDGIGGISEVTDIMSSANGSSGVNSFMDAFGGMDGVQSITGMMGGSLHPLSNFMSQAGGIDKFSNLITESGGEEGFFAALSGNGSPEANAAIANCFGSVIECVMATGQLGGVDNLKSILAKANGAPNFCNSMAMCGGVDGMSSIAKMTNSFGDFSKFKDFAGSLKNGMSSLETLSVSMANLGVIKKKQDELAGNTSSKTNQVTTCNSYSNNGNAAIKAKAKSSMKTRVAIKIEANKDCAIDLFITGNVNLHIEGDVFREIIGNIYDTHLGDHYVYHKGSTFEETKGKKVQFADTLLNKVTGNVTDLIEGSKTSTVYGLETSYASKRSQISDSGEFITFQNRTDFTTNLSETVLSSRAISSMGDLTLTAANISLNGMKTIKCTSESTTMMALNQMKLLSGNYTRITSVGKVDIEGVGIGIPQFPVLSMDPPPEGNMSFIGPVNIVSGMVVNPDLSDFAQLLVQSGPLKTAVDALNLIQSSAGMFSEAGITSLTGINMISPTSVNSLSLEANVTLAGGTIVECSPLYNYFGPIFNATISVGSFASLLSGGNPVLTV